MEMQFGIRTQEMGKGLATVSSNVESSVSSPVSRPLDVLGYTHWADLPAYLRIAAYKHQHQHQTPLE